MKRPGDPWNNRWHSFYGIARNLSMEFYGKIDGEISMEFYGNSCPNPPRKTFPWNSIENVIILHGNTFHENQWRNFHGILILHGIPWTKFPLKSMEFHEVFHTMCVE